VPEDEMATADLSAALASLNRHGKPASFVSSGESHAIGKRKRDTNAGRVRPPSSPPVPDGSGPDGLEAPLSVVQASKRWEPAVDQILRCLFNPDRRPTNQESVESLMLDIIASLPTLSHDEIRGLGLLACAGSSMLDVDGHELACARCDADDIMETDHEPRVLDQRPLEALRGAFAPTLSSRADVRTRVTLLQTLRRVLIHSKITLDRVPEGLDRDATGRGVLSQLEARERTVRLAAG
jgi:hypothetical protein